MEKISKTKGSVTWKKYVIIPTDSYFDLYIKSMVKKEATGEKHEVTQHIAYGIPTWEKTWERIAQHMHNKKLKPDTSPGEYIRQYKEIAKEIKNAVKLK